MNANYRVTKSQLSKGLILGGVVLVLGTGYLVASSWSQPIAFRAFDRLRIGMDREQVENAVGKSRYFANVPLTPHLIVSSAFCGNSPEVTVVNEIGLPIRENFDGMGKPAPGLSWEYWFIDDYRLCVVFDEGGTSVGQYLVLVTPRGPIPASPPGVLSWFKRVLGI